MLVFIFISYKVIKKFTEKLKLVQETFSKFSKFCNEKQ